MKKALCLCFGIILFLTVLSFTGCSGGASLVSTWTGSYSGSGNSGTIPVWKLYDDDTMEGLWVDTGGAFSLKADGKYTLNGTAFTFSASGTATNTSVVPPTSTFTVTGSGTLGSSTGTGSYSVVFAAPSWGSPSGNWSLTKQ